IDVKHLQPRENLRTAVGYFLRLQKLGGQLPKDGIVRIYQLFIVVDEHFIAANVPAIAVGRGDVHRVWSATLRAVVIRIVDMDESSIRNGFAKVSGNDAYRSIVFGG